MLVLSWHFRAATMCEYSRKEFVSGMLRLHCDSLPKLQQKLPELRRDLQDARTYKAGTSSTLQHLYMQLLSSGSTAYTGCSFTLHAWPCTLRRDASMHHTIQTIAEWTSVVHELITMLFCHKSARLGSVQQDDASL